MPTNTKESGFEQLFTDYLVAQNGFVFKNYNDQNSGDYDKNDCLDVVALFEFLENTQATEVAKLKRNYGADYQKKLVARLQKEIAQKGILEVFRKGIKDLDCHFKLIYFKPNSSLNRLDQDLWTKNIFAVTRQLYYSLQNSNSLDMVILVNGLPVMTFELKNLLTGQTVKDAKNQYKFDRSSKEKLFQFERCLVHFAVDTELVYMTTKLEDGNTYFLPFNKGFNQGAGNPPTENNVRTSYLWQEVLTKENISDLLQNFIMKLEEKRSDKTIKKLIFPRYHQLDVVQKLLKESKVRGTGQKYLIQHSAGSGKSNSIAWLSHQLSGLFMEDGTTNVFDSVIVITDRKVLDSQLGESVKSFEQTKDLIIRVESGKELKESLEQGKRIIISTIQKFPVIVDTIGELAGNRFAIIIDEAHSSTGGQTLSDLNGTLENQEESTDEDVIIETLQSRKMLKNASYFAFTATPKNKTLELFGNLDETGKYSAFHNYTMKQAIEEGFILDVLSNYTTYKSYYSVVATKDGDKEFGIKSSNRQLRQYVEGNKHTIEQKAGIMLDHFYHQVYLKGLVGGRAKAMLVSGSRKSAVKYHFAFKKIIKERNYPMDIITAFSGDIDLDGEVWNESRINGFKDSEIPTQFESGEYQILICANKFQTGFDQPLLQTMYVDKRLGGVSAVQTLSRLNRCHRDKDFVFVLDFYNTEEDIQNSFEPYYKTTILSQASDPNKLHDLKDILDNFNVYSDFIRRDFATKLLSGVKVEMLHNILDSIVENIKKLSKEEIDIFKGTAKSYIRFYGFISQIITFEIPEFEELYQLLKPLSKKIVDLGTKEDILSQSVLDSVDFDSYRNEKKIANIRINLSGEDELDPVPSTSSTGKVEEPKDLLANIVVDFNTRFGTEFKDEDKVRQIIEDISEDIVKDTDMAKSLEEAGRDTQRLVFTQLLDQKLTDSVDTHLGLFNNYHENQEFKTFLTDYVEKVVREKLKKLI